MYNVVRKYDPVYKTIDDATNNQFPLDIVDIIHGYSDVNKTQLSNDLVILHTSHVESRHSLTDTNDKHNFNKQVMSYLREIDSINKFNDYGKTRSIMLCCKLFDLLIDMKYIYSNYTVFMSILKNKTKYIYYNKPYLNFAHYYRILFNEEIEVTEYIKDYIAFNQLQFNNPLTNYKVKNKLCSTCKRPGHNKRSCDRWNAIPIPTSLSTNYH